MRRSKIPLPRTESTFKHEKPTERPEIGSIQNGEMGFAAASRGFG